MTPRPYLSYTQLKTLERSEDKYIDIYFNDAPPIRTAGFASGRRVHEALESDDLTGDPVLDVLVSQIPKVGEREIEISTELNGVPLLGRLDEFDTESMRKLRDFKTGISKWSQAKADRDDQLTFYLTLIYAEYNVRPEQMDLVEIAYIPTKRNEQTRVIEVTGDVEFFKTERRFIDILQMASRQQEAWQRINELAYELVV